MSIIFKTISLRNFLSTGAVTQSVILNNESLTLILGENLDSSSGMGRNGVGKTTVIQALSYALYGYPINNIRKDNLINRTNGKNMLVALEFSVDGVDYKIERGRKPNVLRFFINSVEQKNNEDSAQGENKFTQLEIEKTIGMSYDMFRHIVTLNTYTEPFLAMKSNEQRLIIEQLLGITILSEKAEVLKEKIKLNKDAMQQESYRINAIKEANKRVQEQIDALIRRSKLWTAKHAEDLSNLIETYDQLKHIDIDQELFAHRELSNYNKRKEEHSKYQLVLAKHTAWEQRRKKELSELSVMYDTLSHVDIDVELQAHRELATYRTKELELTYNKNTLHQFKTNHRKIVNTIQKLTDELEILKNHKCYACGQDFHDEQHDTVLKSKTDSLEDAKKELVVLDHKINELEKSIVDLGPLPSTHYSTEEQAINHSAELKNLQARIEAVTNEENPFDSQLVPPNEDLGTMPKTYYDTEMKAVEHRSTLVNLEQLIESKKIEQDPYVDQIEDMKNQALQEISFEKMNELNSYSEHLKFLLDLLTNKDSFIRKKIIDQSLSYLNARLTFYLDKIGLPHTIVFKNDLSIEITELGRELDFHNLSRGEMNRLILSLSFAFRDVWENLYKPINLCFIDELLDNGTDSIGVDNALSILKDLNRSRNKSVWLISHREELQSRVENIMWVIKEGGFTSYSVSTEN